MNANVCISDYVQNLSQEYLFVSYVKMIIMLGKVRYLYGS